MIKNDVPRPAGRGMKRPLFVTLALALCFLLTPAAFAQQQWSVGYYTPWGNPSLPPSAIEWGGLTHVIYWGALVQSNGSLDLQTQLVSTDGPAMISNAHAHGVKVLLGLIQGNWLGQNTTLQSAVTTNLSGLVSNTMNAVNTYGFDGVDIDWEPFNTSTNGGAMQQLAAALRAQLGTRPLTCAAVVNDYAYWGSVQSYFDRIQMMTYDLTGTWNPYSWHNAALYSPSDNAVWSVDMAVTRFTTNGVPASKLSLGIPFYGWKWTGGGITGPQQYWSSSPNLQQTYYQSLASMITSSNHVWDSSAQVPYLSTNTGSASTDQFVTYDDAQSITAKVNYAKSKGLGGWIIWELVGDYFPNQTPTQPLLDAIAKAMGTSTTPPTPSAPSITTTSLPGATQNTSYSASLGASGGTQPYNWTIVSGALPAGLSLTASTGVISGVPTTSGTINFTVQVTDGAYQTATKALSIAVSAATTTPTSPSAALFASWQMDEGTGSVAYDATGHGNTMSLLNSPSWLSGASCVANGCLSFNGTSQTGSATLNLSDTNVITVAFWMYWSGYSSNDALAMESTPNFNVATTGFMIDPNSSQSGGTYFEAGVKGDAGYNQILFARPSAGAWHHYAFVFNKGAAAASQVTPYVDGVAVPYTKVNNAQNTNNFGSDPLYVMSRSASSLFGAGRLDNVVIYKMALSASDIQTLASASVPTSTSGGSTGGSTGGSSLAITTTSLPNARRGVAYSATLAAAAGTTPYAWSLASGSLPSGLTLSSTGVISGTPMSNGNSTSSFTVRVTDAASHSATQALSITVRRK